MRPDRAAHAAKHSGTDTYRGRRVIPVRDGRGEGWGIDGEARPIGNFLAPRIRELAALQADTGTE